MNILAFFKERNLSAKQDQYEKGNPHKQQNPRQQEWPIANQKFNKRSEKYEKIRKKSQKMQYSDLKS